MKKMMIFLGVIVVLFAVLAIVTNLQKDEKLSSVENPYGTDDLKASTIDQLGDPNYQNIILPDNLADKLKEENSVAVYYYSPECEHCQKTTPVVAPLAEEMGIDLVQYNLLEFEEGWTDYGIEYTPTIVHYENGKETARIVGYNDEDVFKQWFEEHNVN
jgi:thiol-disulfide isomerase/thioredoxin